MRQLVRLVLAGLLGVCAAALVACGGSTAGYLSSDQASGPKDRLTSISGALSSNDCRAAIAQTGKLARDVADLPPTVSPVLRANLIQGASTIARLTPRDCVAQKTTPTTTTQSTTTAVTQTQTAPATTTATPPATTQAQPPPTTPTQTQTTPAHTTTGTGGAGIGNSGNTGNTGQSSGGAGANTGNTGNNG